SGSHGLACGLFSCDLPCQQGGAQNRDPLQEEREPSTQGSPADRKKLPIKIHQGVDGPGKPDGIPTVIKPGEEHAPAAQQQKKSYGFTKIASLLYMPPAK